MNQYFDENEIRKTVEILKPDGELFEIRVLLPGKRNLSGYFRDADTVIDELGKVNMREANVFITLQGVKGACYDRKQKDKLHAKPEVTTSDNDIEAYEWLLVDLDPKGTRVTGTSSTDAELQKAKALAQKISVYLKSVGFESPVIGMSGNGMHLLYPVSLANTEENVQLMKDCLNALSMMFSTEDVEVDTKNFNPSRICKLYGTLAQKGSGTNERPHRMSYIITAPDRKPTKRAYLQKLADALPKQERPQAYNNYNPKRFNVEEFMNKHGMRFKRKEGAGYTKYILDECPFDSNHKAPDSMITVGTDGAIGFSCFHNSCAGRTWHDVRVLYEPDAYSHEDDDERINAGWKAHIASRQKEPTVVDPEPGQIFEDESLKAKPLFLTARMILEQEEPNDEFIKTGIEVIDRKMRGLKLGGVSLLSGLRGGSKSTLLSQIILSAIDQNQTVIAYSGELKAKQFLRWMLLQAAGKKNTKKSERWENVYYTDSSTNEKIAEWMGERFWLYENDYGNEFLKLYAALERQIAQSGANLIVLDNLMAMDIRELDTSNKYNAQTAFIQKLVTLAQSTNAHIIFVAHPRKAQGFLRLDDISGSADLSNAVDNAFIVHRNNEDFKRLTAQMFQWHEDNPVYKGTNVIEVAKNRDDGVQDLFVPLWYEPESKRLKNSESEMITYGWEPDELDDLGEIPY